MKKTASKKTASKKTAKKKAPARKQQPPLVITVLDDCTVQNSQGVHTPKMSMSGTLHPNHLMFQAVKGAWVCVRGDDFSPRVPVPLRVEAGKPSRVFKLKPNVSQIEVHYGASCDKPCSTEGDSNGDAILIET